MCECEKEREKSQVLRRYGSLGYLLYAHSPSGADAADLTANVTPYKHAPTRTRYAAADVAADALLCAPGPGGCDDRAHAAPAPLAFGNKIPLNI